jgi:adenylate kinase family enzyme
MIHHGLVFNQPWEIKTKEKYDELLKRVEEDLKSSDTDKKLENAKRRLKFLKQKYGPFYDHNEAKEKLNELNKPWKDAGVMNK